MPRAIRVGSVTISPKQATRAVVPGCDCADLMMRLALLPTLDAVTEKIADQISEGKLFTATVVDDIQFLAIGGETKEATGLVTEASRMLIAGLRRNGLEIDLTDKKLQVMCSDGSAAPGFQAAIVSPFLQKGREQSSHTALAPRWITAAGRDGVLRASRPLPPGRAQSSNLSANAPGRRGNSPPACELHTVPPAQRQFTAAGRDGALRASRPLSLNLLAKRRARVSAARNLGADFSLRARSVKNLNDRLQKTAAKARRLKNVKKAGVSSKHLANVAKAGLNSTMLYGVGLSRSNCCHPRLFKKSGLDSAHAVLVGYPQGL